MIILHMHRVSVQNRMHETIPVAWFASAASEERQGSRSSDGVQFLGFSGSSTKVLLDPSQGRTIRIFSMF